jgi:AcrR family transcriptional regulator
VNPSGTLGQRPLRRDAERNRQRILEAARTLFAEQGLGVSHDQLAEAADVAVGTVYRRFPDKESLIEALFTREVDEVMALADAALEITDPWEALVSFMTKSLEIQAGNRSLKELALGGAPGLDLVCQAQARIMPIVGELVARAQAAGVLRPGIGTEDFGLVPIMIGAIIDSARDVDPNLWRRRSAIIHQIGAKETTDRELLVDCLLPNLADREFFIRKAIGWALRQYARIEPDWVRGFVAEHEDRMSGLSRREALKHVP